MNDIKRNSIRERRENQRVPVSIAVRFTPQTYEEFRGKVRNVSMSGLYILCRERMTEASKIKIILPMEVAGLESTFCLQGEVVRSEWDASRDLYGYGVSFCFTSPSVQREYLHTFISRSKKTFSETEIHPSLHVSPEESTVFQQGVSLHDLDVRAISSKSNTIPFQATGSFPRRNPKAMNRRVWKKAQSALLNLGVVVLLMMILSFGSKHRELLQEKIPHVSAKILAYAKGIFQSSPALLDKDPKKSS